MSSMMADASMRWSGLDAMNRLFDSCRFEAIALREGGLRGMLGSRSRSDASLCGFVLDFPCHGRFLVPGGHYLQCHIHQASAGSWCAGVPLSSGTVLIVLSGSACEIMLREGTLASLLVAPMHDGVTRAIERNPVSFSWPDRRYSVFSPDCHAGTAFQFRSESAFHALINARVDGVGANGEDVFDALLDPRLLDDLAAYPHTAASSAGSYRVHYRAFRYAVDYMRANLHRDIYLEELARVAGMSDRGLRYAFGDLLGVSPTRYLALLRLHEASRQLSSRDAIRLSVKSVAMSCGWWDLSRFAANYRRAFDEHPSDTLMRASSIAY